MKTRSWATIGFAMAILCCERLAADEAVPAPLRGWLRPQAWVRDSEKPVLSLGKAGAFDDTHVFAPCVQRRDGEFLLWYCGSRGKVEDRVFALGLTASRDGQTFQRTNGTPVFEFGDGKHSVLTPTILREGERWRMWFSATDFVNGKGLHTLHEATSADGVKWSAPSAALLAHVYAPSVLKVGDAYQMWFTRVGKKSWSIAHATSKDGTTWKEMADSVLSLDQEWEFDRLFYPTVVRQDGVYLMWYGSYWKDARPAQKTALGFAVSADGLKWHKHPSNPVFRPEPKNEWESHYVTSESILRMPDGTWRMWYASRTKPPFTHKYFAIGSATWRDRAP